MKIQIALLGVALLAGCAEPAAPVQDTASTTPPVAQAPASSESTATDMGMSETDHAKMADGADGMDMSPEAHAAMAAKAAGASASAPEGSANEATGVGVVQSTDAGDGTVTIAHEPIESIKWPAMTMAFKASPEMLAAVKEGDRVTFKFTQGKGMSTLSTLDKTN